MRTYDPADGIVYVHLAPGTAPGTAPDECHRLPSGYPNASLRGRLGVRPALVLLPGGLSPARPEVRRPA
jgi:hypothetical protein